jgi:glycosyltransferase involved in cell wall biosynthesis
MNFEVFKEHYEEKGVQEYPNKAVQAPVISIIVQTYQHRNYIRECLDGILNQKTEFPFELVLGDDGSTDGTREICIEYAERFPNKIRLFLHQQENKIKVFGITTGNFNALYNFFSARGTYIAFCEGDDYWEEPSKLQKQVEFLRNNPGFVMSYHSFKEIDSSGLSLPEELRLEQPEQNITGLQLSRIDFHPLLSTVCFRKDFIDIPDEMVNVLNVDSFLLSLLGRYGNGKFHSEIKASIYRKHSGGMWSEKQKEQKYISKIHTFKMLGKYYQKINDLDLRECFLIKSRYTRKILLLYYLRTRNIKKLFFGFSRGLLPK